jgi:hypothetical protein
MKRQNRSRHLTPEVSRTVQTRFQRQAGFNPHPVAYSPVIPLYGRGESLRQTKPSRLYEGWQVQFLEADLKTPLPKKLRFSDSEKIRGVGQARGGLGRFGERANAETRGRTELALPRNFVPELP